MTDDVVEKPGVNSTSRTSASVVDRVAREQPSRHGRAPRLLRRRCRDRRRGPRPGSDPCGCRASTRIVPPDPCRRRAISPATRCRDRPRCAPRERGSRRSTRPISGATSRSPKSISATTFLPSSAPSVRVMRTSAARDHDRAASTRVAARWRASRRAMRAGACRASRSSAVEQVALRPLEPHARIVARSRRLEHRARVGRTREGAPDRVRISDRRTSSRSVGTPALASTSASRRISPLRSSGASSQRAERRRAVDGPASRRGDLAIHRAVQLERARSSASISTIELASKPPVDTISSALRAAVHCTRSARIVRAIRGGAEPVDRAACRRDGAIASVGCARVRRAGRAKIGGAGRFARRAR